MTSERANGDWVALSEDERLKVENAGPGEVAIFFGDHGLRVVPAAVWASILLDAIDDATRQAMSAIGVECRISREGCASTCAAPDADVVRNSDGSSWTHNVAKSMVTVRVRHVDGREASCSAELRPPSLH